MKNALEKISKSTISIALKKEVDIPKPFNLDVFLFDTHIAGTSYIDNFDEIDIKIGEKLSFYREKNEHDSSAIVVKTSKNIKIGYIPQKDNVIFSRLMDAGKSLFGTIESHELVNKWHKIQIKIYLSE